MGADIRFPNLGITIDSLGKSISVGGFSIAYYGIIIAVGMIAGFYMASWQAKRLGQNSEVILDLALWDIFFAIIGARLYYVIFSWDYYCEHPTEIFNIRGGGMAIYGGVIAGELTDAANSGLLVGQIFGRWGNFFNREVFGGYTDNLFAMQLKQSQVRSSDVNTDLLRHLVDIDGVKYIQVHPTFLYESLWNLLLLIVILLWTKKRKFGGQLFLMYLFGYGLGRFWIEGIRVDQLMLFGTGIPVSQLLSGLLAVISGGILVFKFWKMRKAGNYNISEAGTVFFSSF